MNPSHNLSVRYSCLKLLKNEAIQSRSGDALTFHSSHKHANNHGIYGRAIAFILFEAIFLVFAYHCLFHPIPLQSHPDDALDVLPSLNITLTEVKAAVTAISVVWHALACLLIGDIISVVRSAEFMAQYHRLGGRNLGTSDKVSTLTSGLVDNITHFVRGSPTRAFRLAISAMLILMVVGPLGSGMVTVGTIIATTEEWIQVTNVTTTISPESLQQSTLVMRMEREQNITFKYDMSLSASSDPVLIPWPSIDNGFPEASTLTYQSDIIYFSFQCAWMPCSVDYGNNKYPQIIIDNAPYEWTVGLSNSPYGIYVLTPRMQPLFENNITILFLTQESHAFSRDDFFFRNLSLVGVPHAFPLTLNNVTDYAFTPMGAVVRCYPNSRVIPAIVTLTQGSLKAKRPPAAMDDSKLLGNISPQKAYVIYDLLRTVIDTSTTSANQMFLRIQRATSIEDSDIKMAQQVPLSPDEMAANINLYMQSAGKALMSGFIDPPDGLSIALWTFNQTAQITFPVAALVSSKPFLIVFTVVLGLVITLLSVLLWTVRRTELRPFTLENLIEILGSKQGCTCRSV